MPDQISAVGTWLPVVASEPTAPVPSGVVEGDGVGGTGCAVALVVGVGVAVGLAVGVAVDDGVGVAVGVAPM